MGFGALNTGLSGLQAARRGLETTGHNVANAGTDGYSRQRARQVGIGGSPVPAMFSRGQGVGIGVASDGVDRLRDRFLEARGRAEHGVLAALDEHVSTISSLETTFGEPGGGGLQSLLSELWSSFDDVVSRPGDLSARTQVLERAESVAIGIRHRAADLQGLEANAVEEAASQVREVNAIAERIADLNDGIRLAANAGLSPNDLMDQRDLLIGELAELTGATAREGEDGMIDVYVGGSTIVRGLRVEGLQVSTPVAGLPSITWGLSGSEAGVDRGSIGGLLQASVSTIRRYAADLDDVTQRLLTTVNDLHQAGFDLSGGAGGPLFTAIAGQEAGTIALAANLVDNPERLAASGVASATGNLDAEIAQQLAEAGKLAGAPDGAYRTMINKLGVEGQSVSRLALVQSRITDAIDSARASGADVNLDEEMAQMMVYQHAYDAAARFVAAIDQALDTLINVVGA